MMEERMGKGRAGATRQTSSRAVAGASVVSFGAPTLAFIAAFGVTACGRIDLGSQGLGGEGPGGEGPGGELPGGELPGGAVPSGGSGPSLSTEPPPGLATVRPPQSPELPPPAGSAGAAGGAGPHGTEPDASAGASNGGADASALDAGTPPVTPDRVPLSCRGATEFCGADSEDCCLSLPVEGGAFSLLVGNGERAQVEVSSFRLDKYEVTVGRFRAFLAGYDEWYQSRPPLPEPDVIPPTPDAGPPGDAGTVIPLRPAKPLPSDAAELERRVRECDTIPLSTLDLPNSSSRIPLNCIDWLEATAFCAWDGGRLPTYAEWYYAATGGPEQRVYPWGNEPTPSRVYASYGCSLGLERPECTAAYVLPVGSHPTGAALFGQEDLAGSMTEWLQDGALDHYVDGCVDCAGPPLPGLRFWRSGSWVDPPWLLENDYFALAEQRLRLPFLGLRCARDGL